jgi:hypothetical protein
LQRCRDVGFQRRIAVADAAVIHVDCRKQWPAVRVAFENPVGFTLCVPFEENIRTRKLDVVGLAAKQRGQAEEKYDALGPRHRLVDRPRGIGNLDVFKLESSERGRSLRPAFRW